MKINRLSLTFVSIASLAFTSDAFSIANNGRKHLSRHVAKNTAMFSFYGAAGEASVDMNKYNLPVEDVVNEWTAVVQPKTSMQDEGIFLNSKTKDGLFIDTLQYKVKREGGLGLILTELAGGRQDGVGITIIDEVLAGGNAENSGIVPGDSIVALTLKSSSGGMKVDEERIDVSTECLAYDPTIEALTSLPAPSSSDEEIIITVKRIRRQPKVNVKLQYPPEMNEPDVSIELFAGENLRRAMLTRGIKLNDKLAQRFDSGGQGAYQRVCIVDIVIIEKQH